MNAIQTMTGRTKLGLGWSNTPSSQSFSIRPDNKPSEFGTVDQLTSEIARLGKINSGNWWTWSFYVRVGREWVRLGKSASEEIQFDRQYHQDSGERGRWTFQCS